jgi:C-terminal processing protease CtpA/Prc
MVGLISVKLTEPVTLTSLRLHEETDAGPRTWSFSGADMELPSTGVVLAISAPDIRSAAERLISGGRRSRGFLGVQSQNVDPVWLRKAFGVKHGVMISNVLNSSPAWGAGIRAGDILTQYLGRRISSSEQLSKLIAANRPGDVVSLALVRGGRSLSFTVQLSSREAMGVAGVLDPVNNRPDTTYGQPDREFLNEDDYREWIERRLTNLKRNLEKQMDQLNDLQRELERLNRSGN